MKIRPATPDDHDAILDVLHANPGREVIQLVGSEENARTYAQRLEELLPPSRRRIVAVPDVGEAMEAWRPVAPVGVLEYSIGGHERRPKQEVARALRDIVGTAGMLRAIPKLYARRRVDIPLPPNTLHLAELEVIPTWRNMGVATRLVGWAEEEAERRGVNVSLCTWLPYRAIDLYLRLGYRTTAYAVDARYQKTYGYRGRVLMQKQVGGPPIRAHCEHWFEDLA